jgi:hypothetical protein
MRLRRKFSTSPNHPGGGDTPSIAATLALESSLHPAVRREKYRFPPLKSILRFASPAQPTIMSHGNHSSGSGTSREFRTFDLRRNEFRAKSDGRSH